MAKDSTRDQDTLNVWHEQRLVGQVLRGPEQELDEDVIGFRYDPEWIKSGGFAISRSLPLSAGEFPPARKGVARYFFANLLPEGEMRYYFEGALGLDMYDTDFELLRTIGAECSGALSILPVDRQPSAQPSYRKLNKKTLAKLVRERGKIDADLPEDTRARLSLAGFQNKCAVMIQGDKYFMPQVDAPSSHVLKFEQDPYGDLPANEYFITKLAAAAGLPVIDIAMGEAGRERFFQSTRYDREWDDSGNLRRLHQEDFCQALGYKSSDKYQAYGGPSFVQCYNLVKECSSEPAKDTEHLLRWLAFNGLTGASDGHAKNLALLYLPGGQVRLSPFYDLICTRIFEGIEYRLAIYGEDGRNPDKLTAESWKSLAKECGIRNKKLPGKLAKETAATLLKKVSRVRRTCTTRTGNTEDLKRIEKIVKRQCREALEKF